MSHPSKEEAWIKLLAEYPIFHEMSLEQIQKAASFIHTGNYEAGEEICAEGQPGDDVFLLIEGEVEITQRMTMFTSDEGAAERDKSLIRLNADLHPVIGEVALCAHTTRSATIKAIKDVVIARFTEQDLRKVIEYDPHFGYLLYRNLASIIAQRLIKANENVLKLTTAFSLALQRGA